MHQLNITAGSYESKAQSHTVSSWQMLLKMQPAMYQWRSNSHTRLPDCTEYLKGMHDSSILYLADTRLKRSPFFKRDIAKRVAPNYWSF